MMKINLDESYLDSYVLENNLKLVNTVMHVRPTYMT